MDNKIIRFYNQNRLLFWTIVLTIAAVIILIHILNNFIAEKKQVNIENNNLDVNNSTYKDKNYSVISEKSINLRGAEIIDNFINYCNSGEVEKAYKLLSKECKEILYPSLSKFKTSYYNRIFNTKKLFKIQALIANNNYYTYQIDFTEDILSTGKIKGTSIVDYYTVVNNNRNI